MDEQIDKEKVSDFFRHLCTSAKDVLKDFEEIKKPTKNVDINILERLYKYLMISNDQQNLLIRKLDVNNNRIDELMDRIRTLEGKSVKKKKIQKITTKKSTGHKIIHAKINQLENKITQLHKKAEHPKHKTQIIEISDRVERLRGILGEESKTVAVKTVKKTTKNKAIRKKAVKKTVKKVVKRKSTKRKVTKKKPIRKSIKKKVAKKARPISKKRGPKKKVVKVVKGKVVKKKAVKNKMAKNVEIIELKPTAIEPSDTKISTEQTIEETTIIKKVKKSTN